MSTPPPQASAPQVPPSSPSEPEEQPEMDTGPEELSLTPDQPSSQTPSASPAAASATRPPLVLRTNEPPKVTDEKEAGPKEGARLEVSFALVCDDGTRIPVADSVNFGALLSEDGLPFAAQNVTAFINMTSGLFCRKVNSEIERRNAASARPVTATGLSVSGSAGFGR